MTHNDRDVTGHHAGDAHTIVITVTDDSGNTVDITNANGIEWYLKEHSSHNDSDALITKTLSGTGITITDGANGEFEVTIDTGETDGMRGQKYHVSRIADSTGDVSTLFTGTFTISRS